MKRKNQWYINGVWTEETQEMRDERREEIKLIFDRVFPDNGLSDVGLFVVWLRLWRTSHPRMYLCDGKANHKFSDYLVYLSSNHNLDEVRLDWLDAEYEIQEWELFKGLYK